jgi:hypothetical protein
VTINSWTLACLFFGAGVLPSNGEAPLQPLGDRTAKLLMAVGAAIASAFLTWALVMGLASRSGDGYLVERRAGFMINDPAVAARAAEVHKNAASGGDPSDDRLERAEVLLRQAIASGGAPDDRQLLAEVQLMQHRPDAAFETASEWVERRPNDPVALGMLGLTANMTGHRSVEREAIGKLCFMRQPPCESGVPPEGLFSQGSGPNR